MHIQDLRRFFRASPDLRGLLLVVLTGCWLAGIVASTRLLLPPVAPLVAGILALLLIGFCWPQPVLRLAGLTLLCFCLGAWRYTLVSPGNDTHAIRAFMGASNLQVQGQLADDPHLESNSTLLTINAQSISLDQGQHWQETHGQIQVQALGATFDDPYAPRYGDTLQLEGKLTAPPGYATPELQGAMLFPRILITSHGGNPFLAFLYQMRTTLAGILLQALPQPFAALLVAIFLSLRTPALKPLLPAFHITRKSYQD